MRAFNLQGCMHSNFATYVARRLLGIFQPRQAAGCSKAIALFLFVQCTVFACSLCSFVSPSSNI